MEKLTAHELVTLERALMSLRRDYEEEEQNGFIRNKEINDVRALFYKVSSMATKALSKEREARERA